MDWADAAKKIEAKWLRRGIRGSGWLSRTGCSLIASSLPSGSKQATSLP
jgi:hypothetical protein